MSDAANSGGEGSGEGGAGGEDPNAAGVGATGAGGTGDTGNGGAGSGDPSGGAGNGSGAPSSDGLPENWRDIFSGDRESDSYESRSKQLGRYSSPEKFAEAFWNARKEVSERLKVQPLAADATDEQIAEYREAIGIPASADAYELTLNDGLVVSDADKAELQPFLEAAHANNITPAALSGIVNTWYAQKEAQTTQLAERDETEKNETATLLRQDWGADYARNMQVAQAFVNRMPEEVRAEFVGSRLDGSGRGMLNSPEVMQFLVDMELLINPTSAVVPNAVDPGKSIGEELAQIREVMRNNNARYVKDEAMQERYRVLLDAQERQAS